MRRFLTIVLAAIVFGAGAIQAAPRSSQEVHNLKKQQKEQRKQLKEQEHATRKAMSQHPTTKEEKARMNKDLKAQRQVLKVQQKQELSDMKQSHKTLTPHPSQPPRVKGHESAQ
jgi:gas vesicle protein